MSTQQEQKAQQEKQPQQPPKTQQRPKLIDQIAAAITNSANLPSPAKLTKVDKHERVIGQLDDPKLQGLHRLMLQLVDEFQALVPAEGPKDLVEAAGIMQAVAPIKDNLGVVNNLFWTLLRIEHPNSNDGEDTIGVRENWQVVAYRDKQKMELHEFIIPVPARLAKLFMTGT